MTTKWHQAMAKRRVIRRNSNIRSILAQMINRKMYLRKTPAVITMLKYCTRRVFRILTGNTNVLITLQWMKLSKEKPQRLTRN